VPRKNWVPGGGGTPVSLLTPPFMTSAEDEEEEYGTGGLSFFLSLGCPGW